MNGPPDSNKMSNGVSWRFKIINEIKDIFQNFIFEFDKLISIDSSTAVYGCNMIMETIINLRYKCFSNDLYILELGTVVLKGTIGLGRIITSKIEFATVRSNIKC